MVGYGILVARAGAAGVGAGAGVGGIFSSLKGATDSAGKAGGTVTVSTRNSPEFEPDDLEPKTVIKLSKRDQKIPTTRSSRRTIKGGVVISGVPASKARATTGTAVRVRAISGDESGSAPEQPIQWDVGGYGGGPGSSSVPGASRAAPRAVTQAPKGKEATTDKKPDSPAADSAQEKPTVEEADEQFVGPRAAPDTASSGSPGVTPATVSAPIVAALFQEGDIESGNTSADAPQALDEEVTDDEIEIELGEDIAAVIERFGNPSMMLRGIAGQAYTEKYTFRTKEGRKIVVLALNGKVTAITPGPLRLAARR